MGFQRLFVFVEGNDDERFVNKILKPEFEKLNFSVIPFKYAQETKKRIKNFVNSINRMNYDYIYLSDVDGPCVTERKEKINGKYGELIEDGRIGIVIKAIESWYLAGLNDNHARRLTRRFFRNTDNIIKTQFENLISRKFDSKTDFMIEILKFFSIDVAKRKNKSFKYFCDKFISELSEC